MATKTFRQTLMRAERARYEAMTEAELAAEIANGPPDPEFHAALKMLSEAELELFLDGLFSRKQILSIAADRAVINKEKTE